MDPAYGTALAWLHGRKPDVDAEPPTLHRSLTMLPMLLTPGRFNEMLATIRASPLALHLARAPVRPAAARLRPVSMALIGPPRSLSIERATHDAALAVGGVYEAHLRMCGLLEAFAALRGDACG